MRWPKPPKLVRFMLYHIANGVAIGCSLTLLAIWLDIGGLGTMLNRDNTGIAKIILFFQVSLTFGAASMGVALMNLGED